MANPLGGAIGYNIWQEKESNDSKPQILGEVGHPSSMDNAAAAEVRGSTSAKLIGDSDFAFDLDYYQATASWWRRGFSNGFDETPIQGGLSFGLRVPENAIAGFVVAVYSANGDLVKSGFDFVFSNGAREIFGQEIFESFEQMDDDFVSAANQIGPKENLHWSYNPIIGFYPNTFVVGVTGFAIDGMSGEFVSLGYTMNWSFA